MTTINENLRLVTSIIGFAAAIIALVTALIALKGNDTNKQSIGDIKSDMSEVKERIDFTNTISSDIIEFISPKFKKRNKYNDTEIDNWLKNPIEIVNNGLDGKFLIKGKITETGIKKIKITIIISDRIFEQCLIEVGNNGIWDGWVYLRLNEEIKKSINFIFIDNNDKEIGLYNIDLY